jgi:hypothetical protein
MSCDDAMMSLDLVQYPSATKKDFDYWQVQVHGDAREQIRPSADVSLWISSAISWNSSWYVPT